MSLARLFRKALDLLHKGVDVLEFTVNGCKSDVRDYIGLLKSCEHHLADVLGFNFGNDGILKLGLNGRSNSFRVNGSLLTSALNTENDLMLIKKLTSAIPLHNGNRYGVYYLVGGKALTAASTLAPTLNAGTVIYRTGVENPGILEITNRTLHIDAFPTRKKTYAHINSYYYSICF